MHIFIKKYIEFAVFPPDKWSEYLSKDQILESAILHLKSQINKFNDNEKDESFIDQALLQGHEDSALFLLFVSLAIVYLTQKRQFEKAKSLASIGENLISVKLQPEIQSYFYQSQSLLKLYCQDFREEKRLIIKSLKLLNKKSMRYKNALINYSQMLARNGMLKDLDSKDEEILMSSKDNPPDKNTMFYDILLADCIMRGDYEKGFAFLNSFLDYLKNEKSDRYENVNVSLNILSGNRNIKGYLGGFKDVALVFDDFYESRWESFSNKLIIFKEIERFHPYINFITNYLPLHFELSNKNIGKAKYILSENKLVGKEHFLDNLFYARIALLENRKEDASVLINQLMENVRKYGFEKRIAFELQFAKELSPSDLFTLLQKAYEVKEKNDTTEVELVEKTEIEERGLDLIVGNSVSLKRVKELIHKFAYLHDPILVSGETGTGKELVAKAIHDIGVNFKEPFLAINCGALTDTLLQSELFGYEAGAFTGAQKEHKGIFESAGKGTVFLDEFGDISPKMQVSLLRVLESNEIRLIGGTKTRQIECKMVIATNVDLQKAVEEKKFREDLFFRLARFDIKLPALRERIEDIPILTSHFLKDPKGKTKVLSKRLLDALVNYRWPGNIRELKNEMERLKILHSEKELLDLDDFDFTHLQIPTSNSIKSDVLMSTKATPNLSTNDKVVNDRIHKILSKPTRIGQRYEFLKELFQQYKKLTRLQIMEIASISPGTASKDLEVLCNTGFIKKVMPTKSVKSHYFVLVE